MSKVHVVLVSHGFQSHYELGFANGLANNRIHVTLLGSDTTLNAKLHSTVEFINIRGAQSSSRTVWQKMSNLLGYHFRLLKYVLTHRNATIMVVGLVRPEFFVGIMEGFALRLIARKYTLTVHNILPHDSHTKWMKMLYRLIYRFPNLLLVHTQVAATELINKFGIAAHKIVVIEHGSNDAVEPSPLSPAQARQSVGFRTTDDVFLFFGSVAPYKGLDILLDSLVDHPQVKLLVAGRCPNNVYGNEMRSRLSVLIAEGRAIWKEGFLDEAEISTVFAASSAVVLPYKHIDQSGVLLLALTLGVPLIATNVGSFKGMITAETGLVVDGPTNAAISHGIAYFLSIKERFNTEAISAKGKLFSWQYTVKPILPLLQAMHEKRR